MFVNGQHFERPHVNKAHSDLTGPAVRFGVFSGRPVRPWPTKFSSITAEMIQSAWPVACTTGSRRLSAATDFMDVDHIPAGADFVAHLNSQVAECKVVLVVIGRNWLR